jgi:serine/threonine protein kinase/tetratricopeptide (TPR) repeat protein
MTPTCRSCRADLPPRANFCPMCGLRVVASPTAATLPPVGVEAPARAATAYRPSLASAATLPPDAGTAATLPPATPATTFRASASPSAATLPPEADAFAMPVDAPSLAFAMPADGPATAFGIPPDGPSLTSFMPDDAPAAAPFPTEPGPPSTAPGAHDPDADGPLAPGQSFGHRYHVKRLLGLGGMGAVYQAWDTELSIDVAIKLIRPEIMANAAVAAEIQRRFKRELLLARLVTHKNVVRIHDLGEIDGIKYITMSYVDGIDLASILETEHKLTVARALRIARRVCSGLVAAHAAGVVHRDLKPANVMVARNDDALIMDFGIARMTADTTPETGATAGSDVDTGIREALSPDKASRGSLGARFAGMTKLGSMVGTVEYMPPEQARGEPVDQRADVYTFGLMLYDMVAGSVRRDLADTALAELELRMKAGPPPLKKLAPDVPDALAAVIQRCIEPDRDKRFRSTVELKEALNRLDDNGRKIPIWKSKGMPRYVATAAGVLAATSAAWWYFAPKPPPPQKDPVSVVIADLANGTGDRGLDRTIEPVLKLSLEGANFITAFARSDVRRGLGVTPPDRFDEQAARELAVKQGLNVVLAGSVAREDRGYRIRLKAVQAVTGNVVGSAERVADDRNAVLQEAGRLGEEIRQALGDDESDTKQRFAMETLTATSLEVVHDYVEAMDALAGSQFEEAKASFAKAVAADPSFGLAYAGMAIASQNMGKQQDARQFATEAVRHVDRMTERERFRTRGLYYLVTSDYPSCVKEYGALIAKFQADPAARNNLALCSTRLRNMQKALGEMQQAVKILPNRALYRVNLALYAAYASDFKTAIPAAEKAREMTPLGHVPLGFAQTGIGDIAAARATYTSFSQVNALGASHSASALGDLAIYEGRYDEAVRILTKGAAADAAGNSPDRAAAKYAAIAYAEQQRGRRGAALAAARRVLELAPTPKMKFLVARIYAQEGEVADARRLAGELAEDLQDEPRAYAKIVEGELLLATNEPRKAIQVLTESVGMLDTWIGRFTLGRAYLAAEAWPQADSEFDRCSVRRGEALAMFLDEEPTFGYFPQVYYYQGRVREGLGTAGYADVYRQYLGIRGESGEDRLLADVRKRIGG